MLIEAEERKYCCPNCFAEDHLKLRKFIERNGKKGKCSFCNSKNVKLVEPNKLAPLFGPIVELYDDISNFLMSHDFGGDYGRPLWQAIDEDWLIFSNANAQAIFNEIFPRSVGKEALSDPDYDCDTWEIPEAYRGHHWSDEMERMWNDLCQELKHINRFFPKSGFDLDFLAELLPVFAIPLNTKLFYRARISPIPLDILEMGKPQPEKAIPGRMNPRGIAYLYLAEEKNTALAEVRASANDKVTIGYFTITKPLKIIDLTRNSLGSPFEYGDRLRTMYDYFQFLRGLAEDLSSPIGHTRADLDYIPIQYICEFIKRQGYDGIRFHSSIAEGYNVTLFEDYSCDEVEHITVNEVTRLRYDYGPGNLNPA